MINRQTERAARCLRSGTGSEEEQEEAEEEQKRNQRRKRRNRRGTESELADRECSTGQHEWLDDACNQAQDPRRNRRGSGEEQERKSR